MYTYIYIYIYIYIYRASALTGPLDPVREEAAAAMLPERNR